MEEVTLPSEKVKIDQVLLQSGVRLSKEYLENTLRRGGEGECSRTRHSKKSPKMQHSLVSNGLIALYASTDLALQDDTPSFVAAYRGVATENICWHAGDHRQQERAGSDGISHTGGGERLQNARLVAVWVAIAFGMALYYLSRTRSGIHTIRPTAGTAGVMPSALTSQLAAKGSK